MKPIKRTRTLYKIIVEAASGVYDVDYFATMQEALDFMLVIETKLDPLNRDRYYIVREAREVFYE